MATITAENHDRPPAKKTTPTASVVDSYVLSWMRYIDGNVVSEMSRRFISNLMSATAARLVETSADMDTESDDSDNEQPRGHAGNLNLVRRTLQGIASHDTEEGRVSFGRHDACIKMGRDLWATEELTATERWQAVEVSFVEGTFPAAREAL